MRLVSMGSQTGACAWVLLLKWSFVWHFCCVVKWREKKSPMVVFRCDSSGFLNKIGEAIFSSFLSPIDKTRKCFSMDADRQWRACRFFPLLIISWQLLIIVSGREKKKQFAALMSKLMEQCPVDFKSGLAPLSRDWIENSSQTNSLRWDRPSKSRYDGVHGILSPKTRGDDSTFSGNDLDSKSFIVEGVCGNLCRSSWPIDVQLRFSSINTENNSSFLLLRLSSRCWRELISVHRRTNFGD